MFKFVDSRDYEDAEGCTEIDCWYSQLTDASRLRLYQIFNDFRTAVAKGTCAKCKKKKYVDIFELVRIYVFAVDFTHLKFLNFSYFKSMVFSLKNLY